MARVLKTLIPEQGYPHREHVSKRGRSRNYHESKQARIIKQKFLWEISIHSDQRAITPLFPSERMERATSATSAAIRVKLPKPPAKDLPTPPTNPAIRRSHRLSLENRARLLRKRQERKQRQRRLQKLRQATLQPSKVVKVKRPQAQTALVVRTPLVPMVPTLLRPVKERPHSRAVNRAQQTGPSPLPEAVGLHEGFESPLRVIEMA
jgi:hypothetical protein